MLITVLPKSSLMWLNKYRTYIRVSFLTEEPILLLCLCLSVFVAADTLLFSLVNSLTVHVCFPYPSCAYPSHRVFPNQPLVPYKLRRHFGICGKSCKIPAHSDNRISWLCRTIRFLRCQFPHFCGQSCLAVRLSW